MSGATGAGMARRGGGYVPSKGSDGIWTPVPRRRGRVREALRGLGGLVGYVVVMALITAVALLMLWRVSNQ